MHVGMLQGSRVLLTGGSGFAGMHLGRLLRASGADVVELACDVRWAGEVAAEIAAARPVAIAHLAALSSVGDSWLQEHETWEVNTVGTLNVVLGTIQAAPEARVLLASSAEVYGNNDDETAHTEARPAAPISPYGRSKAAGEIAGLRADLDVVVTRAFPHTGPGQSERFAIPAFAHQIARIERGDAPPVLKVGNLAARRDISDVRCVADAYSRLLALRGGPRIVNIASGVDYEIGEVVARLLDLARVPISVEIDESRLRRADIPRLVGDARLLTATTGWRPVRSLGETLRDVLEDARSRVDAQ